MIGGNGCWLCSEFPPASCDCYKGSLSRVKGSYRQSESAGKKKTVCLAPFVGSGVLWYLNCGEISSLLFWGSKELPVLFYQLKYWTCKFSLLYWFQAIAYRSIPRALVLTSDVLYKWKLTVLTIPEVAGALFLSVEKASTLICNVFAMQPSDVVIACWFVPVRNTGVGQGWPHNEEMVITVICGI